MRLTAFHRIALLGVVLGGAIAAVIAVSGSGSSGDGQQAAATPSGGSGESRTARAITSESGRPTLPGNLRLGDRAPDLVGIEGWINTDPFSIKDLKGKVVLVDFWTYTCVNCIRTFPFLKAWHEKYADKGLVIVGVHSPEFDFEKSLSNVRDAAQRHGLAYPIVLDNEHATWDAFRNQFWPRKFLIDKDGTIRFDHIGEGQYADTERVLQRLLAEAGADVRQGDTVRDPESVSVDLYRQVTPELYAGLRGVFTGQVGNYIGQTRGFVASVFGQSFEHALPDERLPHTLYLKGLWVQREESIAHGRVTTDYGDEMVLRYWARSVNLVVRPEKPEPFDVRVTLNGRPLTREDAGDDVVFRDGESFIRVDAARMYSIVASPRPGWGELALSANSDAYAFFAFTFGVGPQA